MSPPTGAFAAPPTPAERRAAIDAKQAQLAEAFGQLGCEAALLVLPAHAAWFTAGAEVRGLIAESERPALYVTPLNRWLVASALDAARLFEEELDQLGFQLKEWQWASGRAVLLGELTAGRKVAADRPFPNLPLLNDKLRTLIRPLTPIDLHPMRRAASAVVHALEATARTCAADSTEAELAGQVAHRLLRAGAEATSVTVQGNGRDSRYGRAGFADRPAGPFVRLQATASVGGVHATASRSACFGPVPAELAQGYDLAVKQAAFHLAHSKPGKTVTSVSLTARTVTAGTDAEFSWRDTQPCYGTGYVCAEELRRAGADEPFLEGQALVWLARVGGAAVVDTALVTSDGGRVLTAPEDWPFRRVNLAGAKYDVPDILVR